MITQFVIFALASAGITLVLVKSSLFKGIRMRISGRYEQRNNNCSLSMGNIPFKEKVTLNIYWFLDSIFNCGLCMGVWASAISTALVWFKLWPILWWLASITVVAIIVKIYERWKC